MKIKTKRYYVYYFLCIVRFCIAILPLRLALFVGGLLSGIGFAVLKKERHQTLRNLRSAFPEKSDVEIEKIAKGIFSNLAKNAVEWINVFKLNKRNIDNWVKVEGFEKLDRAFSKGKGAIMLASHFGNWELIHVSFLLKGYPGTVIARRLYFDKYDGFIAKMRSSKGVGVVYRDESPKKLLRILKQNGLIGILADQDVDSVDGVFVDFFGKPAYTPKAPVAFALTSGAALVPCFIIRGKRTHRLVIEDPVELEEKSTRDETIAFNTQKWSRISESYIRRHPEQWVWMHRRWKTQEKK